MKNAYKKRCLYCGAELKGNPKCCPSCGERLRADEYKDDEPKPFANGCAQAHGVQSRRISGKEVFMLAGAVVLALALLLGGFFIGKSLSKGRQNQEIKSVASVIIEAPEPTALASYQPTVTPQPTPLPTEIATENQNISEAEAITSATEEKAEEVSIKTETGSPFEIHFLDVGQGDAMLIICEGHAMLVDGGPPGASSLIYAYLRHHEVNGLDMVVCTHPHEDHIGGLPAALAYTRTERAMCSFAQYGTERFADFVKWLKGVEIEVPTVGETFALGGATVTVLAPEVLDESNLNNCSLVLKIAYGETSFLLMGDAEFDEEEALLNSGADLKCDVIKIGHHGAATATSEALLDAAKPQYAVISVGENNRFGHPTEETLNRLNENGITVLRTDLLGDIICASDGNKVLFYSEK